MKAIIVMVIFSLVYMVGIEFMQKNQENIPIVNDKDIVIDDSKSVYTVSITGAINNPGTYTVNRGEKLSYLISLAGGVKTDADSSAYNLDSNLKNGITYYIPFKDETKTKVSINNANLASLDSLPGVGSVLASRIVSYRNKNGAFTSIEEIKEVNGIGESLFNQIKDLICL